MKLADPSTLANSHSTVGQDSYAAIQSISVEWERPFEFDASITHVPVDAASPIPDVLRHGSSSRLLTSMSDSRQ